MLLWCPYQIKYTHTNVGNIILFSVVNINQRSCVQLLVKGELCACLPDCSSSVLSCVTAGGDSLITQCLPREKKKNCGTVTENIQDPSNRKLRQFNAFGGLLLEKLNLRHFKTFFRPAATLSNKPEGTWNVSQLTKPPGALCHIMILYNQSDRAAGSQNTFNNQQLI